MATLFLISIMTSLIEKWVMALKCFIFCSSKKYISGGFIAKSLDYNLVRNIKKLTNFKFLSIKFGSVHHSNHASVFLEKNTKLLIFLSVCVFKTNIQILI